MVYKSSVLPPRVFLDSLIQGAIIKQGAKIMQPSEDAGIYIYIQRERVNRSQFVKELSSIQYYSIAINTHPHQPLTGDRFTWRHWMVTFLAETSSPGSQVGDQQRFVGWAKEIPKIWRFLIGVSPVIIHVRYVSWIFNWMGKYGKMKMSVPKHQPDNAWSCGGNQQPELLEHLVTANLQFHPYT